MYEECVSECVINNFTVGPVIVCNAWNVLKVSIVIASFIHLLISDENHYIFVQCVKVVLANSVKRG